MIFECSNWNSIIWVTLSWMGSIEWALCLCVVMSFYAVDILPIWLIRCNKIPPITQFHFLNICILCGKNKGLFTNYVNKTGKYSRVHKRWQSFFSKILEKPIPRTDPWEFHEKILRIGGAGKWGFFEAAILNLLSRPFWNFFCFISVKNPALLYEVTFFSALWMVFPES